MVQITNYFFTAKKNSKMSRISLAVFCLSVVVAVQGLKCYSGFWDGKNPPTQYENNCADIVSFFYLK